MYCGAKLIFRRRLIFVRQSRHLLKRRPIVRVEIMVMMHPKCLQRQLIY